VIAPDNGLSDARDLRRSLALAEDHLREPLPRRSVMVNLGKSQILDDLTVQLVGGAPLGLSRIEPAFAHGIEQRAQRDEVAKGRIFLISQGLVFDSTASRSIELRIVPRLGASRL